MARTKGSDNGNQARLFASDIDWITVGIYVLMVLFGLTNIYAAVFDEDIASMFDLGQRSGSQLLWIGVSFSMAVTILLIDSKYYHMLAFVLYFAGLAVMLAVGLVGTEINGARAWITIGSVRIQPVEFMKFVTALALARYMSSYSFNIKSARGLSYVLLIIAAPVALILMQNDTGSALVFAAFFIMLYREGAGSSPYIIALLMALLFVISFLLEPLPILLIILGLCLVGQSVVSAAWRPSLRYLALVLLLTTLTIVVAALLPIQPISMAVAMMIGVVASLPAVVVYAIRHQNRSAWIFTGVFFGAVLFTSAIDFAFNNILQIHQQKRILDLLGLENDPQGWSYNVIQSKIAIGSGGVLGKGFLGGTQTRFSFVPEQSTDFIFCTVGEEWGFAGSAVVVLLFMFLILRLMRMGERQKEPFARIYCYCVAAIFFVHFAINIGMTIGIFPVVGIPLPFFSYGGSSLLAFTILLFVAIRLDGSQYDDSTRKLL